MRGSCIALAVCLALVTAGCATTPGPTTPGTPSPPEPTAVGTSPSVGSGGGTAAESTVTRTAGRTEPPATTVAPTVTVVPSVADCTRTGLPSPNRTDGLALSAYPDGPETVTAGTVADYVRAFERAYRRNAVIAGAGADTDHNLTGVTVYAETERVAPAGDGYAVSLAVLASTTYASGVHGDRSATVGYFVDETVLVREELDSVNATASPETGTVLLRCT